MLDRMEQMRVDALRDARSEARYEDDPQAEPDTREVAEGWMREPGLTLERARLIVAYLERVESRDRTGVS
jgi:hypothetical protein